MSVMKLENEATHGHGVAHGSYDAAKLLMLDDVIGAYVWSSISSGGGMFANG